MSAASLTVGGTVTLTATASYSDSTSANVSAAWGSSNSSVASVSAAGIVTAHAVGTATGTARPLPRFPCSADLATQVTHDDNLFDDPA